MSIAKKDNSQRSAASNESEKLKVKNEESNFSSYEIEV